MYRDKMVGEVGTNTFHSNPYCCGWTRLHAKTLYSNIFSLTAPSTYFFIQLLLSQSITNRILAIHVRLASIFQELTRRACLAFLSPSFVPLPSAQILLIHSFPIPRPLPITIDTQKVVSLGEEVVHKPVLNKAKCANLKVTIQAVYLGCYGISPQDITYITVRNIRVVHAEILAFSRLYLA